MKATLLRITSDAEALIAEAARISHSGHFDLDKGVIVNGTADGELIRKIISWGHESPLEHAVATFLIEGISRTCSHQLVRHRLASFTQRSSRYCLSDEPMVYPDEDKWSESAKSDFHDAIEHARLAYQNLVQAGVPKEDARFVLPQAESTSLVMTANFREWRHIFKLRCDRHAQWEIRRLCESMLAELGTRAPNVFADLLQPEAEEDAGKGADKNPTTGEPMDKNDQDHNDYKDLPDCDRCRNRCCDEHVELDKPKPPHPLLTYVRQVKALFYKDTEIRVMYSDATHVLRLQVSCPRKAHALRKLFPDAKTFGNTTLKVEIVTAISSYAPADGTEDLVRAAFNGNPLFSSTMSAFPVLAGGEKVVYSLFTNKPVQYWNDDISGLTGHTTELVANVARAVLDLPGNVVCCTKLGDDVAPL